MGVAVCLSINQGELLGKHRGVEASGRKGRGSDDESRGAQLPKKLTVGQNGGGLGGVPQCRRGRSTDHEERDVDKRQRIVVSWAWQRHGTVEARLSLQVFFSLLFFLPPSTDIARNRPSTIEIKRDRPIVAGDDRNRSLPVDFGW
ncbi:hypothetical protein BHM03_00006429 [Ensete ventricosum]|nr:hypothetical protein BHM03_00006429 [Ensete ventricosum]